MRNTAYSILSLLVLAIMLTGCSSRKLLLPVTILAKPTAESVAVLPSANRDVEYLTATLKMNAVIGADGVTAKGKLRLKRSEGVQISATAMGLMEAACFEFLPHTVKFLYKIDKIYAEDAYNAVPFFAASGTGYNILEAVMLNSMFSPDGAPFATALAGMEIAREGSFVTVTTAVQAPVVYRFYIDSRTGNLVKSEGRYDNGGSVVCSYSDFADFEGMPFPKYVELSFSGNGSSAALTLEMNNPSSKEFKFSPRRVSKTYERVSLETIFGSMDGSLE